METFNFKVAKSIVNEIKENPIKALEEGKYIQLTRSNFLRLYVNIRKLVPMDEKYNELDDIIVIIKNGILIVTTINFDILFVGSIGKQDIKTFDNKQEEIIGTTGELVDLFKKELTQEEWNALAIVHRLTNRLNIGIRFDWSKSIDVRSETTSQIIDESVFIEQESR